MKKTAPRDHDEDVPDEESSENFTYEGDRGTLALPLRNVLVRLLKGPYLTPSVRPDDWALLLNYRDKILEQLSNLYLTAVIDEENGIAYVRQAETGNPETPALLRRTTYRLLDSVLIVELRERLMKAQQQGDRGIVTPDEIFPMLALFDPASASDQVNFQKRVSAVIDRFKKARFLIELKGGSGGYEISPVLKVMFGASEADELRRAYLKLLEGNTPPEEDFAAEGDEP